MTLPSPRAVATKNAGIIKAPVELSTKYVRSYTKQRLMKILIFASAFDRRSDIVHSL